MTDNFGRSQHLTKTAVVGPHGIVSAQHRVAAEIGAAVLAGGGDCIDAAVATSFAIGVLEPWMSGIGGVGIRVGRPRPLDRRRASGRAPRRRVRHARSRRRAAAGKDARGDGQRWHARCCAAACTLRRSNARQRTRDECAAQCIELRPQQRLPAAVGGRACAARAR
jgi:hypothetical protein